METQFGDIQKKFNSPQEELEYLRAAVHEQQLELERRGVPKTQEDIILEKIKQYKEVMPSDALSHGHKLEDSQIDAIVLDLAPETHDSQVEELLGVFQEKGLKNALSVVEKLHNPHLEDDFHRALIQFLRETEKETQKPKQEFNVLGMTLYEVSLPGYDKDDPNAKKALKELISGMEQFYAGMISVDMNEDKRPDQNYYSLEIAVNHDSDEVIFYASVPDTKRDLFEKQALAIFPNARVVECKNEFNIFNVDGISVGSYAMPAGNSIYPIKTYENFDYDPLNVILNVFSKIQKSGEGAAIQLLVSPVGGLYSHDYKEALKKIKEGVKTKEAIKLSTGTMGYIRSFVKDILEPTGEAAKAKKEKAKSKVDENLVKRVEEKISQPILDTNLRIVASASNRERAEQILLEIQSAFQQFSDPQGNGIKFTKMSDAPLRKLLHDFTYRLFESTESFPMNLKELTTIMHFPAGEVKMSQLKEARAGVAPAPLNIPTEGIVLGINDYRGTKKEIHFAKEDRVRHFYVIGQTGTGKTVFLKNLINQDIKNGDGVCMIDPHGSDIEDILANIPKERIDDVIYFDPAYMARPMGLNMLEFDSRYPEQKTFVVNEMLSIFNKLFDMKVAGGPAFEQYFRNSALLVLEHPESGSTLLEIGRVLGDKAFREMKLSHCKNPIISQFWQNAEKTTGDQSLANYVPYITNKFDVFISNDIMRPIIAQEKSAFNFRQIMDEKKILLINLAKGRLGDINSSLLGLIIVGKILMAALSRVDVLGGGAKPNDFYLYIDEFQNVTTDSISTILSEARKYRLSLNIAHQFIAQLEEGIRDSVFGNVGSMAVFRVGTEDAEFLEKQFVPVFSKNDIIKLENYNAYIKMLANGEPTKPFNLKSNSPDIGRRELIPLIKELSYLKYGRDRAEIESEIMARYKR